MKKPRKVVAILTMENSINKELVFCGYYHIGNPNRVPQWGFPTGSVEENETPQEAMVRELKEELNITISKGQLFLVKIVDDVKYEFYVWSVGLVPYELDRILSTMKNNEPSKHQSPEWLSAESIDELIPIRHCRSGTIIALREYNKWKNTLKKYNDRSMRLINKG